MLGAPTKKGPHKRSFLQAAKVRRRYQQIPAVLQVPVIPQLSALAEPEAAAVGVKM